MTNNTDILPIAIFMKQINGAYVLYVRNPEDGVDHAVTGPIAGVKKTFEVFEKLRERMEGHPRYNLVFVHEGILPDE